MRCFLFKLLEISSDVWNRSSILWQVSSGWCITIFDPELHLSPKKEHFFFSKQGQQYGFYINLVVPVSYWIVVIDVDLFIITNLIGLGSPRNRCQDRNRVWEIYEVKCLGGEMGGTLHEATRAIRSKACLARDERGSERRERSWAPVLF